MNGKRVIIIRLAGTCRRTLLNGAPCSCSWLLVVSFLRFARWARCARSRATLVTRYKTKIVCICLDVFACITRICTNVRVPARICAILRETHRPPQNAWFYKGSLHFKRFCTYLRISAYVCAYLLHDFRKFARICTYFHGFARIWTYLRIFSKNVVNYVKNGPKKGPWATEPGSKNDPKIDPGRVPGRSLALCAFCVILGSILGAILGIIFGPKIIKNRCIKLYPKNMRKYVKNWVPNRPKKYEIIDKIDNFANTCKSMKIAVFLQLKRDFGISRGPKTDQKTSIIT